jgi:hypothetical protein
MEERATTAPRTRRRLGWPLIVAICVAAMGLGACQAAEEAGPLVKAATRLASNTGRTVNEVTAELEKGLTTLTESEVVAKAERGANNTDWIALLAGEAPRDDAAKTAGAVHDATCEVVDDARTLSSLPTDTAMETIIRKHLTAAKLSGFEERLAGIDSAIRVHVQPYLTTGTFADPFGAIVDFACWF